MGIVAGEVHAVGELDAELLDRADALIQAIRVEGVIEERMGTAANLLSLHLGGAGHATARLDLAQARPDLGQPDDTSAHALAGRTGWVGSP